MNHDLQAATFFAESLRFTLKQSTGTLPSDVLRKALTKRKPPLPAANPTSSPFKRRDPLTQRRLLLAS
jgi:hypothetical protein